MSSPTAYFVALKPPFPILQAEYVKVSCKTSASFVSTNKYAFSLFLLANSLAVLATLSSTSFFHILWHTWQKLSSLSFFIRLQWSPVIRFCFFLLGGIMAWPMSWIDKMRCFSFLQFYVVSRIHTCLLAGGRRTISFKFFGT